MNHGYLHRYGLKFNPFSPEIPTEACVVTPEVENFIWRITNLTNEGGFAMVCGPVGIGKSVAMRVLQQRLSDMPDMAVGVLTRPQSSVNDFYRELGSLYDIQMNPHNRWAGTASLRKRWTEHIDASLNRAVLIVDEAQEMNVPVMRELRLLSSDTLDSRCLLTVVLSGDRRLPETLKNPMLVPVASRIRVALNMVPLTPDKLIECLKYIMKEAGNGNLMSEQLIATVAEHATGNMRVMMTIAGQLLDAAVQKKRDLLDEKLYLETFNNA